MSASSKSEQDVKEQVVDNISQLEVNSEAVDASKLAALKAKQQAKQQENKVAAKIVAKKERSISWGIIGAGQAGGNLAVAFSKLGYNAIALNTAMQDLKFLNLPDSNKLLMSNGDIGGASKELEIGRSCAVANTDAIMELINGKLSDSQMFILCTSLGGGSGSGSAEPLIDMLSALGKPIIVMAVLPMNNEDVQAKSNTLETLAKLTSFVKNKKISNLITIDNAKLEAIYSDVGQMDFFEVANKAIVEPLDMFNYLSSTPSAIKGIDGMELVKILIDGEGLTVYGSFEVENYTDDTAIAESVVNLLDTNLLASGYNLTNSKYVGFIIAANKEVWAKIPSSSVNYASSMVNDICGNPKGVFKGIYVVENNSPTVKVYSIFSGLSLPDSRIDQLKKETAELQTKVKAKDESRAASLHIDTGKNETVSAADKIKAKIAAKNSTFGKFVNGVITDRRK